MYGPFYSTSPGLVQSRIARNMGWVSIIIGGLAIVLWRLVPDLDLIIARSLYLGGGLFVGNEVFFVTVLRNSLIVAFFATALFTIVTAIHLHRRGGTLFGLDKYRWFFVALCMGLGPGIVTNVIVKDQIGRARPKSVQEFGGDKSFSAPLVPAGQCRWSCSFVSGEASSSFVIFYAGAIAAPAAAPALITIGTVAGLLTGLVRMLQGAHFFSDVVFAGVFMALTVAASFFALRTLDTWIRRRWPHVLGPPQSGA
jgi:lipid A 4'-phosphatase